MRSLRQPSVPGALAVGAALLGAAVVAGCGGDEPPSTQRYCDAVRADAVRLSTPAIATADDIDATLDLYRRIAGAAPLAVEVEWATMVLSVETAATVVPSDQASMQQAADTARASRRAAEQIQTYTQQVCGVDIGTPPTTVAVTVPPTTSGG